MLISLLDLLGAQKGAAPGGNGLLARVVQKKRDEEAAGQPPQRRAPVQFPQGQGQPAGPQSAAPEELRQAVESQQLRDMFKQSARANLANLVLRHSEDEILSPRAVKWIEDASDSTFDSGPGKAGTPPFARIIRGDGPPGLSKRGLLGIRRDVWIMAGLQTLSSDRTGLAAVAEGGIAGLIYAKGQAAIERSAIEDEFDAAKLEAAQDRAFQIYSEFRARGVDNRKAWRETLRNLQTVGDTAALEHARGQFEVAKDIGDLGDMDPRELPDGSQVLFDGTDFFDPATKERITDPVRFQAPQEQVDPLEGSFREEVVIGGVPHIVLFDRGGNAIRDLGPSEAVGAGAEAPTTAQIEARSAANRMQSELETIEETLDSAADIGDTLKPGVFKSEDRQRFEAAGNNLAAVVTRALFGAAATDEEFKRVKRDNIPRFGDKPEVIENKLARIRQLIEQSAAVAAGQFPGQQDAGGEDLPDDPLERARLRAARIGRGQ